MNIDEIMVQRLYMYYIDIFYFNLGELGDLVLLGVKGNYLEKISK